MPCQHDCLFTSSSLNFILKDQLFEAPSDHGRAVPLAERTERHVAQQSQLAGIRIAFSSRVTMFSVQATSA
jgi:hypothetical protein